MTAPDLSARTTEIMQIMEVVRRHFGFDELRPLQLEAIEAGLGRRDSLVVMPTGGGKSLCYQVPPLVAGRMDVVVSPLISLMRDQVAGLHASGYPAAAIHSNLTAAERHQALQDLRAGRLRLLFVSPERLVMPAFLAMLEQAAITSFAIDEAHCISHWGHDFRPEYRQLALLRERFPQASLHAFTATATPPVREDIVRQLRLRDAQVLVGRFDRENLTYRIVPRTRGPAQVLEVVRRHAGEAVIVYCITRKDSEALAGMLCEKGIQAAAYHAGLDAEKRRSVQDAFSAEALDVVVATVAFGMGIDRSDVRCVVHANMPKTIEHYQQETGRAGRDGLEAECVLLHSPADAMRWRDLIGRSAAGAEGAAEAAATQIELLRHMQRLCGTLECRHRALARYFGEGYERPSCGACDVCLGESAGMPGSTVTAQKILSCVYRVEQRFGAGHVVDILRGADSPRIRQLGHERLSTWGLLSDMPEDALRHLVYQLLDQGYLTRSDGDRPVLQLNEGSWAVLRGERQVQLIEPRSGPARRSRAEVQSWEGVDRGLVEHLRRLRRDLAAERRVPPYILFNDATLRELARVRPADLGALRGIHGIGERKLADLGERLLLAIADYARSQATGSMTAVIEPRLRDSSTSRP